MFQGSFSNTLDDKGRVAIPARFREFLTGANEERIVVTGFDVGPASCLEAYPGAAWDTMIRDLQSKTGAFAHIRLLFESVYIGNAQSCQLDKQGRILLPPSLRDYASLTHEVVFVGVGRKFQVFSPEARQKVVEAFRQQLHDNPNLFHDLGI
jgi:MraZ protein